jgi:hypothetical protein
LLNGKKIKSRMKLNYQRVLEINKGQRQTRRLFGEVYCF